MTDDMMMPPPDDFPRDYLYDDEPMLHAEKLRTELVTAESHSTPAKTKRRKAEIVEPPTHGKDGRAVIIFAQGERARVTRGLAQALANGGGIYFSRGGGLVRLSLREDDDDVDAPVRKFKGSVSIQEPTVPAIIADASRVATMYKLDSRTNSWVPTDIPDKVAQSLIAIGPEMAEFPLLTGITQCPIIRDDGSIHGAAGYDRDSNLYLSSDEDWSRLRVPARPTRTDAYGAMMRLIVTTLNDFAFDSEVSLSSMLSAILTAVIRPTLDAAPLHGFSAPTFGEGKSLQAFAVSMIATGGMGAVVSPGHNQEEFEKRVDSVILSGSPVVTLDNASRAITGDNLCMALTSPSATVRIFGTQVQRTIETSAFWMTSGANLTISADMVRRTVVSYMDASLRGGKDRKFLRADLLAYIRENRVDILEAVFTMLRAHAQAGYPNVTGDKPLGSFGQWSRRVVNLLTWLGMPNPVESQKGLLENDPYLEKIGDMLDALYEWQVLVHEKCTGRATWKVKDVREAVSVHSVDERVKEMRYALESNSKDGVKALPYWLRKNRNVQARGKRLVCASEDGSNGSSWIVELT
ncbi:hypothetical protein [Paraburkholderia sp. HD33-4]|uniref:hypothetical protein n=1 Tax=Paraburkholderia sp. HD33-4 TaxID=2883242 RepID=UPI001F41ED56|nr:hypothetical protein [Paraburkholderia sp. HD33-4]